MFLGKANGDDLTVAVVSGDDLSVFVEGGDDLTVVVEAPPSTNTDKSSPLTHGHCCGG